MRIGDRLLRLLRDRVRRLYDFRRRLAIGGVIAVCCLIAYHAVFGANGFVVYHQKRAESQKLDQEIKALQEENSQHEKEIKALKTDPETIEKEAREHLRYARPGEVIYTLPRPEPVAPPRQAKP